MKKLLLASVIGALMVFTSCNKDDGGEVGSTLMMTIDGEITSLAGANFYLSEEGEFNFNLRTDGETPAATHEYAEVYITDADWSDEESSVSYEIYVRVEFPAGEDAAGEYEMTVEEYDANTRFGEVEIYYDPTDNTWAKYNWLGWDGTLADGDFSVETDENDEDLVRVLISGNAELWPYDGGWEDAPDETDLSFSLDFEGLLDESQLQTGVQRVENKGKKFVKLN